MGVRLDKRQIRTSFAKAAQSYDAMAALQRRVACKLVTKVTLAHEAIVLDIGCGTGFFTQKLRDQMELHNILALDIAFPMLVQAQQRFSLLSVPMVCADAESLPFFKASLEGVTSNLALQWCSDLDMTLSEIYRVLKSGGQLVFSTFGERALYELKNAWAETDDYSHVNDFCSLAMIEVALNKAGFTDIQVESILYPVKYETVIDLMRELKGIGAHNVSQDRNKKLTTKGQLQKMLHAYPKDKDGQVTASYEIIYVQAKVVKEV